MTTIRDKRGEVRTRVNYTVWLQFEAEAALVPCTLVDISASGARLQAPAEAVPDSFMMKLSETYGASRICLVIWRAEKEIGVRFMDPL